MNEKQPDGINQRSKNIHIRSLNRKKGFDIINF